MIPKLKSNRIETDGFILNITKEKFSSPMIIGFVELQNKRDLEKSTLYAVLGMDTLTKCEEYDEYRLHLILLDLGTFTYELTIKFYDDYAEIKVINLYTNQLMLECTGSFLADKISSDYTFQWENSRTSQGIDSLELKVKKVYYKTENDHHSLYENGVNLSDFLLEYCDGSDTVNGFDTSGKLILKSAVVTSRLNNMLKQSEMNMFGNPEDNICYLSCFYKRYGTSSAAIIMILKGKVYLFQCEVMNLTEKNERALLKVPKMRS